MTITITRPGERPRYACELCRCEIVSGHGTHCVLDPVDHGALGETTYDLDPHEHPLKLTPNCACRCHEPYRILNGIATGPPSPVRLPDPRRDLIRRAERVAARASRTEREVIEELLRAIGDES